MNKMADSLINDFKKLFGFEIVSNTNYMIGTRTLQNANDTQFHKFSRISTFAIATNKNLFFISNKDKPIGVLCFEFTKTDKIGFLFMESHKDAFYHLNHIEVAIKIGKYIKLNEDFLILDIQKLNK